MARLTAATQVCGAMDVCRGFAGRISLPSDVENSVMHVELLILSFMLLILVLAHMKTDCANCTIVSSTCEQSRAWTFAPAQHTFIEAITWK